MFPFHNMAMPLMPQVNTITAMIYHCYATPSIVICCDSGTSYHNNSWTDACGSQLCVFQTRAPEPLAQLHQLRKQLESAMAGVEAQERALGERQETQPASPRK